MGERFIKQNVPFPLTHVNLMDSTDSGLETISSEAGVGLSLSEMKSLQEYFQNIGRNPTDIEFQAIGQEWSEHCSYKSSKKILKKFVFGIDAPQNISVIKEDAGVLEFDNDHAYVFAMESHNHPSAVEPYGGAATGVGGIVRDVVCMGAQPIALLDPLFFAPLDYSKTIPPGTKHPRFLFNGVVSGIRDYGNRIGIPTVSGMVYFDDSYLTNCLVNVGCIGFMKKSELVHSRAGAAGDVFILIGGATGRDGIHGVTFASADLNEDSETSSRSAVQVGQPIIKEPVIHICLEAQKRKIITGMKDLGGGGLSCVVSEMAEAAGLGAKVELDKVHTREKGMAPWEIWVSESQERMMVTAKPENVQEILDLCKMWDIPASAIGDVIPEKKVLITYNGEKIFDLGTEFLVQAPLYERPIKLPKPNESEPEVAEPKDYNTILKNLVARQNIASREGIIRGYDHEVRAGTVLKPLQGQINAETHGDAAVIKPLHDSFKGLAVTSDINPRMCQQHPYKGAASALDESCRNLASVGARPHSFSDCLNFGNPEKPENLGIFHECARGLGYVAKALGVPFASGNVSLYNEGLTGSIAPTPAIVAVGIVKDIRKTATSYLKKEGNILYIIGETKKELGASEYYAMLGVQGGVVPDVDAEILKKSVESVVSSIEAGLIESCHDVSDGGLAVCLAEMCFGKENIGADIDVSEISNIRPDFKLFSESNTRWVVEVSPENKELFENIFRDNKIPVYELGTVTRDDTLKISDSKTVIIDTKVSLLRREWVNGLNL